MKKITFCLMLTGLSLTFQPIQSHADNTNVHPTSVVSELSEAQKAESLLLRLDEINAMDKSNLKSSDKRALRREVRSIQQQLKENNGGVYISLGAAIIIVLLLIIIF